MDGKPEPENMAVTEKEINQSSYCQDKDQRKQNGVNQIHLVGRKKRTQKFWQNSNQVIEEVDGSGQPNVVGFHQKISQHQTY